MNRPWTRPLMGALAALALMVSACAKKDSEPKPPGTAETPAQEPAQHEDPLLAEGARAPDFTAQAHDGTTVRLAALEGQPVVLYFYPRDATPG
jgi:thioredoxin-dependent peroxiredoxin